MIDLPALIRRSDPAQDHWEVEALVVALIGRAHRTVLEIGTHQGGSARLWRDAFDPELLITVCESDEFTGDSEGITRILGRSQDEETYLRVLAALDGAVPDFLFIDGGHSGPEVKTDAALYGSLVRRPGGTIAFHDVNVAPGVTEVWEELQCFWPTALFYRPPHGTGTGVVFL